MDALWLGYLSIPTGWTIFFSMFNRPSVRGWRNFGWPTCYIVGVAMIWGAGWRPALANWFTVGVASGLLYFLYEAWSSRGEEDPDAKARLTTILHGVLAWPIMLPEVIEYTLADVGILKCRSIDTEEPTLEEPEGGVEREDEADKAREG